MTNRSGAIGMALSARPKTATITASRRKPADAPISVERQPRVAPTPTTMVTISMASTADARNVMIRTGAIAFTRAPAEPAETNRLDVGTDAVSSDLSSLAAFSRS
jgi:hypothetical protein